MVADFPSKKKNISDDVRKQNAALKKKFNVSGFPTILFLSADGKELGRLVGYAPDSGPGAWITKANAIIKSKE